jgi:hypothetical protein
LPVRRLFFILLVSALVGVPSALAGSSSANDGVLELKTMNGTATIGTIANLARGAVWGQLDSGTLTVLDPLASDGKVFVSGYDKKPVAKDTLDGRLTTYAGKNLHFRVTGGVYKLVVVGTGLDLTAVGVGVAYLNGDLRYADDGSYAVDDGKWLPVLPVISSTKPPGVPVPFGTQPASQTQP